MRNRYANEVSERLIWFGVVMLIGAALLGLLIFLGYSRPHLPAGAFVALAQPLSSRRRSISLAMAAGVKFGRKPKLSDFQRAEVVKRRAKSERLASIAKSYGVSLSMISRL